MIKIRLINKELIITVPIDREGERCDCCGITTEGKRHIAFPSDSIRLIGLHIANWTDISKKDIIESFAKGVGQ